jgi:hypothetical protein
VNRAAQLTGVKPRLGGLDPSDAESGSVTGMPEAPRLSAEQRAGALVVASAARAARAQARADLKSGRLSLAELLDRAGTDEQLATMRVTALLAALPGYGKVRAAALLSELRIAESRRLRGLGPRQRAALLQRIEQTAQSRS